MLLSSLIHVRSNGMKVYLVNGSFYKIHLLMAKIYEIRLRWRLAMHKNASKLLDLVNLGLSLEEQAFHLFLIRHATPGAHYV